VNLLLDHVGGHNLKIKYDWFGNSQESEMHSMQKLDVETGFLREWLLVKMEGADLISNGTGQNFHDPKNKAKTDKKPAIDVIPTDNNMRTVKHSKEFLTESGQGIFMYEDICMKLSQSYLTLCIINNEEIIERIQLDLSCLLWPEAPNLKVSRLFIS